MENKPLSILIVEDEDDWARLIERVVEDLDWKSDRACSSAEALKQLLSTRYDIVILDRLLGATSDGLTLIETVGRLEITPMIIVISQLTTTQERVLGLESGADDYLGKPFEPIELRARLIAIARRLGQWPNYETVRLIGQLEVREQSQTVKWRGENIELPKQLFDLLWFFADHSGAVLSKEVLWREVWKDYELLEPQLNTVEAAVSRLRKILFEQTGHSHIQNIRGQGYVFDEI